MDDDPKQAKRYVSLYFVHFFHFIYGLSNFFFIDGPRGTGKTFLYCALLANILSKQIIFVATITLGMTSSILPGGRTSHLRFKILINVDDSNLCNLSKQSGTTELLRIDKLIIWDETPMPKRLAIETLDRT